MCSAVPKHEPDIFTITPQRRYRRVSYKPAVNIPKGCLTRGLPTGPGASVENDRDGNSLFFLQLCDNLVASFQYPLTCREQGFTGLLIPSSIDTGPPRTT